MTVVFITSSGTSPWNKPGDWTDAGHTVELVGCGGQSGAGSTGTSGRGGGGGAGGGYTLLTYSSGAMGSSTPFACKSNATAGSGSASFTTFWEDTGATNAYEGQNGGQGSTTSAGSGGQGNITVGTPSPITYTSSGHNGSNGGAASTTVIGGGGGGGGAGGPAAIGGTGAGGGTTAGFGGGGGGAANNNSNGASVTSASGSNGGTGVGPSHGGGAGSTSATSANGSDGIGGQGGGGGCGTTATSGTLTCSGYNGGPNGNVSNWVQTSDSATAGTGAGGGGAGGASGNTAATCNGGNGGNYGSGGGGPGGRRNTGGSGTQGTGASGIIVITYTAAAGTQYNQAANVSSAEGVTVTRRTGHAVGIAAPQFILRRASVQHAISIAAAQSVLRQASIAKGIATLFMQGLQNWLAQSENISLPLPGPGDIVGSASGWWGLRAYSIATRGNNAINLRRDSDNATSDFATLAASGDLDVASITSWKGAANLFCTKLYDQTGNGHDVSQATAANQPPFILNAIGTKPALRGNGSNYYLNNNSSISASQPFSLSAFAMRSGGATANAQTIWASNSNSDSFGFSTSTGVVSGYFGATGTVSGNTEGNYHAFNIAVNGASSNFNMNGTDNTVNLPRPDGAGLELNK